ncbi:hypothetical protein ACJJTC_015560 [Scirpophaga incertulas]
MAAKFIALITLVSVCQAVPVWVAGTNGYVPIFRMGRSPNVAFGFGSGFSSNIGGIAHSTGIGSSFSAGDAEAYGAGMSGATGGSAFGRGVGIANAAPYRPLTYSPSYNTGRNTYGSAISSAQNFGNYGSVTSAAQTMDVNYPLKASPAHYQSAQSSAQSFRGLGYESALASANLNNGLEYGSAVSAAENTGDYNSSMSSAQSRNGLSDYNAAVAAAQNMNGYHASTAQTVQQHGSAMQHSGASSIDGPGIQAAQSHAVNTGYY